MSDEPQTVWITKYALSEGVREVPLLKREDGYVSVQWRDPKAFVRSYELFHGRDYHDTQEAALARAEEMRLAKIASHEKSIAKLRKLSFA